MHWSTVPNDTNKKADASDGEAAAFILCNGETGLKLAWCTYMHLKMECMKICSCMQTDFTDLS